MDRFNDNVCEICGEMIVFCSCFVVSEDNILNYESD